MPTAAQNLETEFRLMPGEDAAVGLKRILMAEIAGIRDRVGDAGADRTATVHFARRRLKRVKSLLLALEPVAGAENRTRVRLARDVGRLLAGARDADVMLSTAEKLTRKADAREAEALATLIAGLARIAEAAHAATIPLEEVAAKLRRLEADAASLPAQFDGEGLVRDALALAYRDGRRHWHAVDDGAAPEVWHEWRKHVKHRYHLTMVLIGRYPLATRTVAEDLDRLAELIGRDHDLSMLEDRLDADPALAGGSKPAHRIRDLIRSRRRKLRKRAIELGEELYGERTRNFRSAFAAGERSGSV